LESALEKDSVRLYAYVLMSNHYHLFLETPQGNMQRFMQRLNTAYSMYFRYKHDKPGHCLQGRYKAKLVEGDDYIVRLTRYIHLNPVKTPRMRSRSLKERKARLDKYPWSSYPGYMKKDAEQEFVDYRWRSLMERKTDRGNRQAYKRYAESMIAENDDVLRDALSLGRYAIGDEEFVKESEQGLKQMQQDSAAYGDIILPEEPRLSFTEIEELVAGKCHVAVESLHRHGRSTGIAKALAVDLCCRFSGKTQRDVARHFGYKTDAGVTNLRRMLERTLSEDAELDRLWLKLKRHLLNHSSH